MIVGSGCHPRRGQEVGPLSSGTLTLSELTSQLVGRPPHRRNRYAVVLCLNLPQISQGEADGRAVSAPGIAEASSHSSAETMLALKF
ncbi:hypothetical protein H920_06670 [Fukomys damarensis]|uniref:Uncharacterized protein n=1 Tax=Fukomys damarensis TaxID=885580 RepID=A0A091DIG0_FUKDA|nr:hypothetical protein H920_06670 [Fukomys damarensis]